MHVSEAGYRCSDCCNDAATNMHKTALWWPRSTRQRGGLVTKWYPKYLQDHFQILVISSP